MKHDHNQHMLGHGSKTAIFLCMPESLSKFIFKSKPNP